MSWFVLLGIAALVVAIAAVTGLKPKGSKHVAHTHLMNAARVILVIIAIALAVFAYTRYRG